ncbi:MAG: substrate-binding domain-containing protein [Anaerolineae bacterium]
MVALSMALVLSACHEVLVPLHQQAPATEETEEEAPALMRVAACWAALPMVEDLAAAYAVRDPYLTIDVVPANSMTARSMLEAGQVDVAIVAEDPDARAARPRQGFTSRVLALDAVTVVVNRRSPLTGLSTAQLMGLYTGDYYDWSQLGAGEGRPEVVVRDEGSMLRGVFEAAVMEQRQPASTAVVMPHDRGVIEYVAGHPNAIGYVSRAYVGQGVKSIAVDGVAPTPQALQRQGYMMWYTLEALAPSNATLHATRFLAFAQSSRGRNVIEQRYVLPR